MMKFGLELLKMVAKMQGGATDDTYFAKNYIFKEFFRVEQTRFERSENRVCVTNL